MYNQKSLLVTLSVVVMLSSATCAAKINSTVGAEWSKEAQYLNYEGEKRQKEIISPNSKAKAIINDEKIEVIVDGRILSGMEDVGITSLAELGWSPDSKAFFVTQSFGGSVGEYRVTVYLLEGGKIRGVDVSAEAVKEFEKHYKCVEPEEPNIGAAKWVDSSNSLLLVAEVPPHSSCLEMEKIGGYLVVVPTGKIIQEFEEKELRARWEQYLGTRFVH